MNRKLILIKLYSRLAEISMLLSATCLGAIFFQEGTLLLGTVLFLVSLFFTVSFDWFCDKIKKETGDKNDI